METPFFGITGIDGAAIPIITGNRAPRLTYPVGATISCGADTAVIAGRGVIHMLTSCLRVTAIGSADIPVIAGNRGTCNTLVLCTAGLFAITDIVIRTVTVFIALTAGNRGMETAGQRIAGIGSAAIPIITVEGRFPLADPVYAAVFRGAYTVIVTECGIVTMLTACLCITTVIGTDIPVITVEWRTRNTLVIDTPLCPVTQITVSAVRILGALVAGAAYGAIVRSGINQLAAVILQFN